MRREIDRLKARQAINRKNGQKAAAETRGRLKVQRMAEAIDNETLAERRARLVLQLEIAESLSFAAPQAAMLREGLAELPAAGSPEDALTWREFCAVRHG